MEEITLDSGLDESSFGKTDFSQLLTEKGYIAEQTGTDGTGITFSFTPWSFSSIRTEGDGEHAHVFFCGTGFAGTPLSKLFAEADADSHDDAAQYNAARAAYASCIALRQAAAEGIPVGNTGAGGIYADISGERISILFMPPELFDAVCGCAGAGLYAVLQGVWNSKALAGKGNAAAAFTAAVIAYRALTGRLPYADPDETARNADELDRNYLRLEHAVNGINSDLAAAVDDCLELPAAAQQKKAPAVLPVRDIQAGLLAAELGLPGRDGTLVMPSRPGMLPEAEFKAKVESYYKAKTQKVKASRTFRRNTALIGSCAAIALIAAGIAVASYRDAGTKPSSRGLTSAQTVEAFYKGIHTQDVQLMGCVSSGKEANRYSDSVSQIYVVNKTRNVYEQSSSIVTPEAWLLFQAKDAKPETLSVYGITSFKLDGQDGTLLLSVPARNSGLPPVKKEGSTVLTRGCRAVHTADYYMVHTEGQNNDFAVEHHTDTVTLTYKKDKWIVTGIAADVQVLDIQSSRFKQDYMAACSAAGGNGIQAVSQLRQQYAWLPDDTVMEAERAAQQKAQLQ